MKRSTYEGIDGGEENDEIMKGKEDTIAIQDDRREGENQVTDKSTLIHHEETIINQIEESHLQDNQISNEKQIQKRNLMEEKITRNLEELVYEKMNLKKLMEKRKEQ